MNDIITEINYDYCNDKDNKEQKLEVEYIEPNELAGKTVVIKQTKKYRYPEPYNYKITGVGSKIGNEYSLFLTLFNAFNDNRMVFIEYLLRNMNSKNFVEINFKKLIDELKVSRMTIHRWIGSLVNEDFMVKVDRKKYMINPLIVINYRKTKNQQIYDLIENYNNYKTILKEK